MSNADTAPRTYSVRLGVSITRTESLRMRKMFGNSHVTRTAKSLKGWDVSPCDCHGLMWSTLDPKCPLGF